MNPIKNAYNYLKYGKVVYRDLKGNTIRKKVNHPGVFDSKTGHINTIKTVLDSNGKVQKQIERTVYKDENMVNTTVKPVLYDTEYGTRKPNFEQPRSKNYVLTKDEKRLYDYSKPEYDYAMVKLPNGKTQYTITYPETTIINKKDGTVKTSMHTETVIK